LSPTQTTRTASQDAARLGVRPRPFKTTRVSPRPSSRSLLQEVRVRQLALDPPPHPPHRPPARSRVLPAHDSFGSCVPCAHRVAVSSQSCAARLRVLLPLTSRHSHTRARARAHARTRTRTHTRAHAHAHTHTRTRTHTHTHTRAHAHTHTSSRRRAFTHTSSRFLCRHHCGWGLCQHVIDELRTAASVAGRRRQRLPRHWLVRAPPPPPPPTHTHTLTHSVAMPLVCL
jgi:hypothetical protein